MTQEPANAESQLEEQLVAYLDGELDNDSCRRIEELLAVDADVRKKLHWLEETWEILDELDTAPVGEDFTRTTLEMVAVAAEADVQKDIEAVPRRRRMLWLLTFAAMLITGVTGYMAVALTTPNINNDLLRDLPILENLDEYRQIKDVNFLYMLQKVPSFAVEDTTTTTRPIIEQSENALTAHVKTLNLSQKYDLLRKQQRFNGYTDEEKARLRELYQQIYKTDRPEELLGVMNRYYEWYKSLEPYDRPPNDLTSEKRIEWINNRLLEGQTKITSRPPTVKDANTLWCWMEHYAESQEKTFIDGLPKWIQQDLKKMSASVRRQALIGMMWFRASGGGPNKNVKLTDEDMNDLRSKFTAQTQKLLESKSPAEQIQAIQKWAHNLLKQKRGSGIGMMINDEMLADFFEKDIDDEDRNRLMSMSGDDMQRELLRLYITKNRSPDRFQPRPDDFRPNLPPGEGPNPPPHDAPGRD